MKPLAIDLCCGTGGWTEGLMQAGYHVIGYDITDYGSYPGEFRQADVLQMTGYQFRGCTLIVASPPCQEFSRWDMPWLRRKNPPVPDLSIWRACERIAREAKSPIVLENVRGAQRWVGAAVAHIGSRYLWGDVPLLIPDIKSNSKKWTNKESYGPSRNRVMYRSRVEPEIGKWIGEFYDPSL